MFHPPPFLPLLLPSLLLLPLLLLSLPLLLLPQVSSLRRQNDEKDNMLAEGAAVHEAELKRVAEQYDSELAALQHKLDTAEVNARTCCISVAVAAA